VFAISFLPGRCNLPGSTAGWKTGTTAEFLELEPEESAYGVLRK
jgi:hypothetical protein